MLHTPAAPGWPYGIQPLLDRGIVTAAASRWRCPRRPNRGRPHPSRSPASCSRSPTSGRTWRTSTAAGSDCPPRRRIQIFITALAGSSSFAVAGRMCEDGGGHRAGARRRPGRHHPARSWSTRPEVSTPAKFAATHAPLYGGADRRPQRCEVISPKRHPGQDFNLGEDSWTQRGGGSDHELGAAVRRRPPCHHRRRVGRRGRDRRRLDRAAQGGHPCPLPIRSCSRPCGTILTAEPRHRRVHQARPLGIPQGSRRSPARRVAGSCRFSFARPRLPGWRASGIGAAPGQALYRTSPCRTARAQPAWRSRSARQAAATS